MCRAVFLAVHFQVIAEAALPMKKAPNHMKPKQLTCLLTFVAEGEGSGRSPLQPGACHGADCLPDTRESRLFLWKYVELALALQQVS